MLNQLHGLIILYFSRIPQMTNWLKRHVWNHQTNSNARPTYVVTFSILVMRRLTLFLFNRHSDYFDQQSHYITALLAKALDWQTAYCLIGSGPEPIWLCVGGISDPPPTEYYTYPIKYLNSGLFWDYQTLGGHGHSDGYDQLLFGSLRCSPQISRVGSQIMPNWSLRISEIETFQ